MTRRGDLFDLMDRAPVDVSTFTASLRKWSDVQRSAPAREELMGDGGGLSFRSRTPAGQADDEHVRVWLAPPDRWRIESDTMLDLRDGPKRWYGRPDYLTESDEAESGLDRTEVGILMAPGAHLMGVLDFKDPVDDEVDGRRCWRCDTTTPLSTQNPQHRVLQMRLGGTSHRFWFDVETGVVLRHVGLFEGEPCARAEFTGVTVNQPIPDQVFHFVPPPGGVVERRIDQMIRLAEQQGADLSDVDRTDPKAVQAAMSAVLRPPQPTPAQVLDARRAKHLPVGQPPADQAAARVAIEYAYAHLYEMEGRAGTLVNVQGHPAWMEALLEASQRIPGSAPGAIAFVVDDIKFLSPDQAVVWFSLDVDGARLVFVNAREGRAVLADGRWLVEHATVADLLGLARVAVPPPTS